MPSSSMISLPAFDVSSDPPVCVLPSNCKGIGNPATVLTAPSGKISDRIFNGLLFGGTKLRLRDANT